MALNKNLLITDTGANAVKAGAQSVNKQNATATNSIRNAQIGAAVAQNNPLSTYYNNVVNKNATTPSVLQSAVSAATQGVNRLNSTANKVASSSTSANTAAALKQEASRKASAAAKQITSSPIGGVTASINPANSDLIRSLGPSAVLGYYAKNRATNESKKRNNKYDDNNSNKSNSLLDLYNGPNTDPENLNNISLNNTSSTDKPNKLLDWYNNLNINTDPENLNNISLNNTSSTDKPNKLLESAINQSKKTGWLSLFNKSTPTPSYSGSYMGNTNDMYKALNGRTINNGQKGSIKLDTTNEFLKSIMPDEITTDDKGIMTDLDDLLLGNLEGTLLGNRTVNKNGGIQNDGQAFAAISNAFPEGIDWTSMFNTNAAQWDAQEPVLNNYLNQVLAEASQQQGRNRIDMLNALRNQMASGITTSAGLGAALANAMQAGLGVDQQTTDALNELNKERANIKYNWLTARNQDASDTADNITQTNIQSINDVLANYYQQLAAAQQTANATKYAADSEASYLAPYYSAMASNTISPTDYLNYLYAELSNKQKS